jgi:hypothetical protein
MLCGLKTVQAEEQCEQKRSTRVRSVIALLPLLAAIFAVPQFLPQLARLRRTGDTAGVSWTWAA